MNAGIDMREGEAFTHCWSEHEPTQPLWKLAWRFPKRLEIELLLTPLYRSYLVHQGFTSCYGDIAHSCSLLVYLW